MRNHIILSLILFLGIMSSCTDNFEELNTDKKHPLIVTGDVLFTNSEIDLANQISNTNVNLNTWKLMAQYWTERSYTDESNYNIVNRRIPDNLFRTYYAILLNLGDAKESINGEKINFPSEEINKNNRLAIIELIEVYIYQRLVDMFGDIPYTEALSSTNYTPVYDDAQTIYIDLISKASTATSALDASEGSFGSADLIYGGDVAEWTKFGYSLLVKLGIGIADGPLSQLGKSTVEAAYANVFESQDDGAYFPFEKSLPYVNQLHVDLVLSGRTDFIIPNTIWDVMTNEDDPAKDDPRKDNYFENLDGIITPYGAKAGSYSTKVHYNATIGEPNFKGMFLTYGEVQFYLAEAAARGWSVGASAESYFNEGVKTSILEWDGTEAEVSEFLANYPYSSYANWREAIGTQAWVAMYTRGFVGYTFARRLDYPILNMPPNPPTGVDEIPTRFTYPINEQTLNADNYNSAASAIGGDKLTTRLFWDIY